LTGAYHGRVPSLNDLRSRLVAARWVLFDAALAAALTVMTFQEDMHEGSTWWIFGAPMIAGLLLRRRWPVFAVILTGAAAVVHHLDPDISLQSIDLAVPLTVYTLATRGRSRRGAVILLGAALVCVSLMSAVQIMIASHQAEQDPNQKIEAKMKAAADSDFQKPILAKPMPVKQDPPGWVKLVVDAVGRVVTVMLALALAFAIGDGVRSRREHLATLEKRAADLEREQRQRVTLAMAGERARITRELHDVIAHALSVMVVQAQGGAAALRRHPERTEQALQNVITTGRSSLTEMRRLLDLVRQEPAEGTQRSPQPGVGALPELIDTVRSAGTLVTFTVEGDPVPLPLSVDLSAYRIVQEALTNTIKHGGGTDTSARIRLSFHADELEIEVTDDGRGGPVPDNSEGNGLRGIAERVGVLGGELTVGPLDDGGFRVHAVLPLRPNGI
jgi:signal transduction histidine kinase